MSGPEIPATEDELKASVYGETEAVESSAILNAQDKTDFKPWHHPVKQLVRDYQWTDAAKRLLRDGGGGDDGVLRYFTLPGPDLFDVRMLAGVAQSEGKKVEYFGFDAGAPEDSGTALPSDYLATESALRQASLITDNAEILSDRLEDIAQKGSQAENRLKQKLPFDVVNVDACDHIAYVPQGRTTSIFDAITRLMTHQLKSERPWLLFVTTRANPDLLGGPGGAMQAAIHGNLEHGGEEFAAALAECLKADAKTLTTHLNHAWTSEGLDFLKVLAVGIGKYLLQFFHGQPNLRATVKMESAFAYRVYSEQPDMLSLAFRITPAGLKAMPPSASVTVDATKLEPKLGIAIVNKTARMWDLDEGIKDDKAKKDAIEGSVSLLSGAGYDIKGWVTWLNDLPLRKMQIQEEDL